MHQVSISDEAYQSVAHLAKLRQMSVSDVLESLVIEEAAGEAQLRSQLSELLASRRASALAGNTKPVAEVLDRLAARYSEIVPSCHSIE